MEKVLVAAIHYDDGEEYRGQPINIKTGIVFCAHRHYNVIAIMSSLLYADFQINKESNEKRIHVLRNSTQGFITTSNIFVNRKEAYEIAVKANQLNDFYVTEGTLFSENLY